MLSSFHDLRLKWLWLTILQLEILNQERIYRAIDLFRGPGVGAELTDQ